MNIKKTLTIGIAGMAMWANAVDASIAGVTARQRYPWNGKVDISYTVTGIVEKAKQEGLVTTLKVSAIDLSTCMTNVATILSGDVSLEDGTHKIVWDMNAQGLAFKSTNVVFNVACETKNALYCIVDLSAGADATSYIVLFTNEIPGGSWSDEYKTTKLVLRRIEPGTCVVTVDKPYYIGVFEVTQKQYALITGAAPSYFAENDKRPVECVSFNAIRGSDKGSQYPDSTDVDDDSCIGKMRKRTGMHFDLPTESQWEYACRAGTTTTYSYGDNANGDYMWYNSNSSNCTHDVGTRKANPWGLYDMHGNVWEKCLEWSPGYLGTARMQRGGGWYGNAMYCTSSMWMSCNPPSGELSYVGFRLVRTLSNNTWSSCCGKTGVGKIDLSVGARVTAKKEKISYSTEWDGVVGDNAMAIVAVDGVTISELPGSGMIEWIPMKDGAHSLTHKVMVGDKQVGETLTATFVSVDVINPDGGPYKEMVDDVEWTYGVTNKLSIIGYGNKSCITNITSGPITVPTSLGCAILTRIDAGAFAGCDKITKITIPVSVTNINVLAFAGCNNLVAFDVSTDNPTYASVDGLLYDKAKTTLLCVPSGLTDVTIPVDDTSSIAEGAFSNCSKLVSVTFAGTPPAKLDSVFNGTPPGLVVHADATKAGWISWGDRALAFDIGTSGATTGLDVRLTVTNVVVHYIQTSDLSPMAAPISGDVGIVNVMTEIRGGKVSVPDTWAANYPGFEEKFGSDFGEALAAKSGKYDAANNALFVWQDYVVGTDPTDETSVFKASVTMVEGKPVISYTPELSEAEKAKRNYVTWGKVKLQDEKWVEVPSGSEDNYNFFKVTVEMK